MPTPPPDQPAAGARRLGEALNSRSGEVFRRIKAVTEVPGHEVESIVHVLKIDRSFVSGLHEKPRGETLVRTLVQLGKALSIETCAEGIEEESELELLRGKSAGAGQRCRGQDRFPPGLGPYPHPAYAPRWVGLSVTCLPAGALRLWLQNGGAGATSQEIGRSRRGSCARSHG